MEGAANINDFKPILVESIYKLIVKVLTSRMAKVIDKVVGECHHASMEGRQILDAGPAANDILCKLDREKANDNVN